MTRKGPQLWQYLPAKMKKQSPQRASSRTLSCGKILNAHSKFSKHTLEDWDSYKKTFGANFNFFLIFF